MKEIRRTIAVLTMLFVVQVISAAAQENAKLESGKASGSFSVGGKSAAISHAAAFIDESDDRKPVVLVLSENELPVSKWKSGSDYTMYRMDHPFTGVTLWLDDKREVFRTEYNDGSNFPTSASGLFELKLDPPSDGTLTGAVTSTAGAEGLREPVKLNVRFNAKLQ